LVARIPNSSKKPWIVCGSGVIYLAIYSYHSSKTRIGKKGRRSYWIKKKQKNKKDIWERKEKVKMGKKYVALLLVWVLVGACVEAMTLEERRNDCNNYCYHACMFPSAFCKWWCGGRCQNPIFWGNFISLHVILLQHLIFSIVIYPCHN